jgi:hypothetical protein
MAARKDPAEEGFLRFFYRGWRPTAIGRIHNRIFAWMAGLGLLPDLLLTLRTKDRRSGRLQAHILAPATYEGHRYLISMLGEGSNWVQNVRAMNGAAYIQRVVIRPVVLTEIPAVQRAPILKAWCQIAISGRRHLPVPYDAPVSAFEAIARDYPVFRIDAVPEPRPG